MAVLLLMMMIKEMFHLQLSGELQLHPHRGHPWATLLHQPGLLPGGPPPQVPPLQMEQPNSPRWEQAQARGARLEHLASDFT